MSKKLIRGYVDKRININLPYQRDALIEFFCEIFRRPATTEYGLMINFDINMQPKVPLSHPSKLGRPDFPIPFSFFYGYNDWVLMLDEGSS